MNITETKLPGVYLIEPKVFGDERGYFSETYKKAAFDSVVGKVDFIQDNQSKSQAGVLRGLHFQRGDQAQAKLVRCIQGSILDVAVDVRKSSAHFGQWVAYELSESNHRQLFVPRGFAHGFLTLSEALVSYRVDNTYAPEAEGGLMYNDPAIGIDWGQLPAEGPQLSDKDRDYPGLHEAVLFS